MWGGGVPLTAAPPLEPKRKGKRQMECSEIQQDILVRAWLLDRDGSKGQVLEEWAMADAQRLVDAGWLDARYVDNTDDVASFWTREAEMALDVSALNQSVEGRQN